MFTLNQSIYVTLGAEPFLAVGHFLTNLTEVYLMMLHTKYQLRDRRGCQGHTVNKLGRGQLGNVTKQKARFYRPYFFRRDVLLCSLYKPIITHLTFGQMDII